MGVIRHHALIVTGTEYRGLLDAAHRKAVELFGEAVSPLVASPWNGFQSFLVAPDGSKEKWNESQAGDLARDRFVAFLESIDDGFGSLEWVELTYGADGETPPAILRHTNLGV